MFYNNEILRHAKTLRFDFTKFSFENFKEGINVELEHKLINSITNITTNDLLKIVKISLTHLNEFSNYYNKNYVIKYLKNFKKIK